MAKAALGVASFAVDVVLVAGAVVTRLAWRWRSPLTPVWIAAATAAAGTTLGWLYPAYWWTPATLGVLSGPAVWLWGSRLSQPLQRAILAVVPSALDDGKKGVLDRDTERAYLSTLILGVTGWVSWLMLHGWDKPTWWVFAGCTVVSSVPWWWHRRIRRSVNRYIRRHAVIEETVKGYESSRATLVTASRNVTVVAVRLGAGKTIEHVGGRANEVASAYGLRMGGVTLSADPKSARRVLHRIVPRDPWGGIIPHPMPPIGAVRMADDDHVMIARLEDGSDLMHRLGQHTLCVGQSGSGKSVALDSLMSWMAMASTVDARIVAADMANGVSLGEWEPVLAAPLATNPKDALILLQGVMNVITAREKVLKRSKAKKWVPTPAAPWLFVVIDEFPSLIRSGQMVDLLVVIAERARKTGVWLYLAAQNGSKADLGSTELRAQMMATIGLRLDRHMSSLLWGDGAKQGWDSTALREGTLLLRDADHNEPRVAKGVFTTERQREGLIRAVSRTGCVPLDGDTHVALLGDSGTHLVLENEPAPAVEPVLNDHARRNLDELAAQLYDVLPASGGSGRRVDYLMSELQISRGQVNRALARLGDKVTRPSRGEWTRS